MRDLKKHEQAALEAVAKRFWATWEKRDDLPGAFIVVAGRQVAVDIATFKERGTGQSDAAKPRLRFDKVATGLIERLKASAAETVPDGTTVLLTVTAPILLPSKTSAALEDKLQTLIGRGSSGRAEKHLIHGNLVQIRLLRDVPAGAPKLIGFVHNPDSDPRPLFHMSRELLELGAQTGRHGPGLAGRERWLVAISSRSSSHLLAYRYIYSQLRLPSAYKKILVVFGDRQIGELAE